MAERSGAATREEATGRVSSRLTANFDESRRVINQRLPRLEPRRREKSEAIFEDGWGWMGQRAKNYFYTRIRLKLLILGRGWLR